MKKTWIMLCVLLTIVLTACGNTGNDPSEPDTEQIFIYGKYYRDGDVSKEYIEILSEDTIDFSHADTEFIVSDFMQLRKADFPDDTEEELKNYQENLEELLQKPYTFKAKEGEETITIRVYSIDGEDLSAKLLYNKTEGILLWGKLEYQLVEE